jgi:hypothetical protein
VSHQHLAWLFKSNPVPCACYVSTPQLSYIPSLFQSFYYSDHF